MNISDFNLSTELLLLILPLIVIQYGLAIYCAVKIFREGVQNLNKWIWLVICFGISMIGSITFLIVGRKRES